MPSRLKRACFRLAVAFSLGAVVAGILTTTRRLEIQARSPYPLFRTLGFKPSLVSLSDRIEPEVLNRVMVPREFVLRRGETLGGIFRRLGLASTEAHDAVQALAEHVEVSRLRANERYAAYFDSDSKLVHLTLKLRGKGEATVYRFEAGWESRWQAAQRTFRVRRAQGSLEGLLESSIRRAGGDPRVAYRMADVLQWDLDFNRDLRPGDRFCVLYEEEWLDGELYGVGEILALVYENRGKKHEAYRFGDRGHYARDGRPLRKQFLRSPLPYSRITSRFSHRRFHPVLKSYRPHYGVDYGAPVGTGVRVTARGVVTFAGWDRGGGNTVKVRHPNGYLTAYLHLSRFAKGLRPGTPVEQGQVIGYVGSTGLATGPHLDYRVQRGGRWINPLSLDNVPAEAVPQDQMQEFLATREALEARLEQGASTWPQEGTPSPLAALATGQDDLSSAER